MVRGPLILGAVASLAACSGDKGAPTPAAAEGAETIECALRGAEAFKRECVVERAPQGEVLFLVVRHPDGAFRRFQLLRDGRGIAVADGADRAETKLDGQILEVKVDTDRYRFPATPKQHVPSS